MNQDIFKFINGTVKQDLPNLAKKKPYLGSGIIAGGIEFMGACLDSHPINHEGASASRFCLAINELFEQNIINFQGNHHTQKPRRRLMIYIHHCAAEWLMFFVHRACFLQLNEKH
jgi:hypothetical protein